MALSSLFKRINQFFRKNNKETREEKDQGEEVDRSEKFKRVYKLFLETLISIFYPIDLRWYEIIIMVIMGVLCGMGVGKIIKHFIWG